MYDVTDYEECNPEQTPLYHLTLLDTECLGKTTTGEFFENEMIQKWISSKIKTNIFPLVLWLLSRIFFVGIFVSFEMRQASFEEEAYLQEKKHYDNYTNASMINEAFITKNTLTSCLLRDHNGLTFDYICALYILLSCLFLILSGIYEMKKAFMGWHFPMLCYPHRRKKLVNRHSFVYLMNSLVISTFAIIFTISKLLRSKYHISISLFLDDFLYFCILLSTCVEFILVCQVLPKVGSFPMIINRLFADLFSFWLILVLFMCPFTIAMYHTVNRRKEVCMFGFKNHLDSFYSIFLAMNNMLDIHELAKELKMNESTLTLYVLHYLYVFNVNILMLNFLIALFSHSVAKTMENEKILVQLNNLGIMIHIEIVCNRMLGWWFQSIKRKCLTYRDGRLFLTSVSIKTPSKSF